MNAFETSTTVGPGGEIHVAGVPFQPGAEVAVVISAKADSESQQQAGADDRLSQLFAALGSARNVEPVGPLNRDELYDRHDVR